MSLTIEYLPLQICGPALFYLMHLLYQYHQLFIDIKRENISCVFEHVSFIKLLATINLYLLVIQRNWRIICLLCNISLVQWRNWAILERNVKIFFNIFFSYNLNIELKMVTAGAMIDWSRFDLFFCLLKTPLRSRNYTISFSHQ